MNSYLIKYWLADVPSKIREEYHWTLCATSADVSSL